MIYILNQFPVDLLNPHGSDETLAEVSHVKVAKDFLTHTVQMKPDELNDYIDTIYKLLNPHGSDETHCKRIPLFMVPNFLTHTVQMKLHRSRIRNHRFSLSS